MPAGFLLEAMHLDDKEYSNVYAIPANYTDSGKLFGGMVDTRNAVEAVLLLSAVGAPSSSGYRCPAPYASWS